MSSSGNSRWTLRDSGFPQTDRLFRMPPFGPRDGAWETTFVAAMREAFDYHYARSPEFRAHAEMAGFVSDRIQTLADVEEIPWIFVQNFKEAELLSVGPEEVARVFTSSGTQGAKTKLFLDATSLNRLEVAAFEVYRGAGVFEVKADSSSAGACNYLMFTYDIEQAPDLGTAWTDVTVADMGPGGERVFLIRKEAGSDEFRFDLERAVSTFERFVASGKPLRLLGFPAFMYHTLLEAKRRGIGGMQNPAVAGESWVLTGGGWKNHLGEAISKSEFASFIEVTTSIPASNVRDLFGMSEHGVGYIDCELGRLHFPTYSHGVARDPATLKALPPGQPGMLHLYSPLLKSYPSISLLTTDEVRIVAEPCPCGRSGMGLEYVGRMGMKHHDSCAIRALEYLNR